MLYVVNEITLHKKPNDTAINSYRSSCQRQYSKVSHRKITALSKYKIMNQKQICNIYTATNIFSTTTELQTPALGHAYTRLNVTGEIC